jgi:hypothetical protein
MKKYKIVYKDGSEKIFESGENKTPPNYNGGVYDCHDIGCTDCCFSDVNCPVLADVLLITPIEEETGFKVGDIVSAEGEVAEVGSTSVKIHFKDSILSSWVAVGNLKLISRPRKKIKKYKYLCLSLDNRWIVSDCYFKDDKEFEDCFKGFKEPPKYQRLDITEQEFDDE